MGKVEITDFNLTGREKDILDILWKAGKGMIASEIVKEMEGLTINTVQAVLKKLLKKEKSNISAMKLLKNILKKFKNVP